MQQLTKTKAILYHLYPGIIIATFFAILTSFPLKIDLPQQFSILIVIALVAIPLLAWHLSTIKREENIKRMTEVNGYQNRISTGKLITWIVGLGIFLFLVWGTTQPLNKIITEKMFSSLPSWYTVQEFNGYGKQAILITLVLNLLLNGIIAPLVGDYYFRCYLLPRMTAWGKWAFAVNAISFSIYHFWQPYFYLTLLIALLPLSWSVWNTKDLRVGIYTHCQLNIIGALASFGLLLK